jgi:3-oxoacyl-[acyl-carrier-protein] synthase-3
MSMTDLPLAITGLGIGTPSRVVTNADLEQVLDTSDEWISTRSGIRERHWVAGDESTASLAADAVEQALKESGRTADEVGMLVVATCTPDLRLPGVSSMVADRVGIRCGAFDLNGACAGFVTGLVVGSGLLATADGPVVVVGSDRMTALFDPADRTTAVLFGDGAGAAVLEPGTGALLGWHSGTDGSLQSILEVPLGGSLHMEGQEVFKRAMRVVVSSAEAALAKAGVAAADVDLFIPHQANARIIESARGRLGIAPEKVVLNLDRWGNTSAASIPIALAEAHAAGRVADGAIVLASGFGAGMTWSSAVLRWGARTNP